MCLSARQTYLHNDRETSLRESESRSADEYKVDVMSDNQLAKQIISGNKILQRIEEYLVKSVGANPALEKKIRKE